MNLTVNFTLPFSYAHQILKHVRNANRPRDVCPFWTYHSLAWRFRPIKDSQSVTFKLKGPTLTDSRTAKYVDDCATVLLPSDSGKKPRIVATDAVGMSKLQGLYLSLENTLAQAKSTSKRVDVDRSDVIRKEFLKLNLYLERDMNREAETQEQIDLFPHEIVENAIVLAICRCDETADEKTKFNWVQTVNAGLHLFWQFVPIIHDFREEAVMSEMFVPVLLMFNDAGKQQYWPEVIQLVGSIMSRSPAIHGYFWERGFPEYVGQHIGEPSAVQALCSAVRTVPIERVDVFVGMLNQCLVSPDCLAARRALMAFKTLIDMYGNGVDISGVFAKLPEFLGERTDSQRVNCTLLFMLSLDPLAPLPDVWSQIELIVYDTRDFRTHQFVARCLIRFVNQWRSLASPKLLESLHELTIHEPHETGIVCVTALALYTQPGISLECDVQMMQLYLDYVYDGDVSTICLNAMTQIVYAYMHASCGPDPFSAVLMLAMPSVFQLMSEATEPVALACGQFLNATREWLQQD